MGQCRVVQGGRRGGGVIERSGCDEMVFSHADVECDRGECAATGYGVGREEGYSVGARRVQY